MVLRIMHVWSVCVWVCCITVYICMIGNSHWITGIHASSPKSCNCIFWGDWFSQQSLNSSPNCILVSLRQGLFLAILNGILKIWTQHGLKVGDHVLCGLADTSNLHQFYSADSSMSSELQWEACPSGKTRNTFPAVFVIFFEKSYFSANWSIT